MAGSRGGLKVNSQELLNHLYFNKLPSVYREEDLKLKTFPLKRYLQSLLDGGFQPILESINNLPDLLDPYKCPKEYLPYLCRSFGLEYFNDIDDSYYRKFLANIGEINKRRGTYAGIRYLIKTLTNLEVNFEYKRGVDDKTGRYGRYLYAVVRGKSIQDVLKLQTDLKVIERFINTQIPYYITSVLSTDVEINVLRASLYRGLAMKVGIFAELKPRDWGK